MSQPFKVTPPVRLKDYDPDFHAGRDKDETREKTDKLCLRIGELQSLLNANATHSLLLIFQGMDCSGKDGAIKNVLQSVNPAGIETANFKAPSPEELSHDFLWRVHRAVPSFGNIGVFNRSHYEEVLIVRVLKLKSCNWQRRYEQINAFEELLVESNVVLLKFFLHLSKKEQADRLRARLEDPQKQWKFSTVDLQMRRHWSRFQEAYQDTINACSTKTARWHIVPADRKWYRDFAVAQAVVEALEGLKMKWPKPKEDLSKVKIA